MSRVRLKQRHAPAHTTAHPTAGGLETDRSRKRSFLNNPKAQRRSFETVGITAINKTLTKGISSRDVVFLTYIAFLTSCKFDLHVAKQAILCKNTKILEKIADTQKKTRGRYDKHGAMQEPFSCRS
jgi:hypothetical protein